MPEGVETKQNSSSTQGKSKDNQTIEFPCVVLPSGQSVRLLPTNSFIKRLMGIHLQKPTLDEALWIPKCRSVHTFFCPPIGVVFIRNWKVLAAHVHVLPNQIVGHPKADGVLEFFPGSVLELIREGDVLEPKGLSL